MEKCGFSMLNPSILSQFGLNASFFPIEYPFSEANVTHSVRTCLAQDWKGMVIGFFYQLHI